MNFIRYCIVAAWILCDLILVMRNRSGANVNLVFFCSGVIVVCNVIEIRRSHLDKQAKQRRDDFESGKYG